jgi:hypothetical protein
MKRCARCGVERELADFNRSPKNRDGRHSYCRECQRAHYRANAARHALNVRRSADRRRRDARRLMAEGLAGGCVDCGIRDLRVLEFDHVRGVKVSGVGELVRRGAALSAVAAEIAKCEVRCRNCHAIATVERLGGTWHSAWVSEPPRRDSNSRPAG